MAALRIGVATCAAAPDLDEDGPLLLAALSDAGVSATVGSWDDPGVDWAGFDGVLVRSTWDHPLRRAESLAWVGSCRTTANPAAVLEWNTDKRYLDDLAGAGVPTIPTVFVAPGAELRAPAGECVVKPSVSGGAADTGRFPDPHDPAAEALVARLHAPGGPGPGGAARLVRRGWRSGRQPDGRLRIRQHLPGAQELSWTTGSVASPTRRTPTSGRPATGHRGGRAWR